MYLFVYGFILIPFQSFSKYHILAQKKKEFKAKAAKDGSPKPKGGLKTAFLKTKYYNNEDVLALAGDRAVGNVLEQALVYLPLFWMHALFVDPSQSKTIAIIYTVSRAIYPLMYIITFNGGPKVIFLSTLPGYLVTLYLFYKLVVDFVLA